MRKLVTVLMGVILIGVLGACSLDDMMEKVAPQAMGVLVYGDEGDVDQTIADFAKDLVEHDEWNVKTLDVDGHGPVMAIRSADAATMVDAGIVHEVIADDKTQPLEELPAIDGDGLWLTKSDDEKLEVNDLSFKNAGNYILGNGRTYVESFLIVPDADWEKIDGDLQTVGFLHFHEDENPKHQLMNFDESLTVQLFDLR